MQYTHVATITTKPGQLRDFLRKVETELLPIYRQEVGLVVYTVAKTGDATAASFGIWQQRAQAEQAIKVFDKWLQEGAGKLIDSLHNYVGELPFLAVAGKVAAYSSEYAIAAPKPVAATRG